MPRFVDLTHPIRGDHWRWRAKIKNVLNYEENLPFCSTVITLGSHVYTHVDAPKHFIPGGKSLDEMPLDQWCGEAAVVDLSMCGPDEPITAELIERCGGHIREGDIALLRTDWPLKRSIDTKEFWTEAPYTTREACEWLVDKRVKVVGSDYPPDYCIRHMATDPDRPISREECTTHFYLFPEGVCVVEYLTNLHLLKKDRVMVYIFPLPIVGGDGCPVRAVAREE